MYSLSIDNLIQAFKKLPTVGQRTSERFVFHLLKSGKKEVGELALALKNLTNNVKSCKTCWDFTDTDPCCICLDKTRDESIMCIVGESQDVLVIEKTCEFKGLYHILRAVIRVGHEEKINNTKISELFKKIKAENKIKEIILALNPDLNGETTAMYLEKQIGKINPDIKISKLARGLPMGSDLQYADEITLGAAIKNRN